jgi:hypothetical protein
MGFWEWLRTAMSPGLPGFEELQRGLRTISTTEAIAEVLALPRARSSERGLELILRDGSPTVSRYPELPPRGGELLDRFERIEMPATGLVIAWDQCKPVARPAGAFAVGADVTHGIQLVVQPPGETVFELDDEVCEAAAPSLAHYVLMQAHALEVVDVLGLVTRRAAKNAR